jgi:hypothetical protein
VKPIAAIVAGTGFYSPDVIRSRCIPGTPLRLKREPSNSHDANAIAVVYRSCVRGIKLGHLKASLAARLAPHLDAGEEFETVVVSVWAPPNVEHPRLSISISPRSADVVGVTGLDEAHEARP